MSLAYLWDLVRSLPNNIYYLILSMAGLSIKSKQIVRVVPDHPAQLRLLGSSRIAEMEWEDANGSSGEEEDVESVTDWIWRNVPSLKGSFEPSWWLPNGHLQTTYSALGDFTTVDKVEYKRTYMRVPDGGTLALDFTPPDHDFLPSDTPIVVICHGLTGGSHESYVRNVLAWAIKSRSEGGLGARAVVVNFRGCAGTPLTSPQFYSAGTTIDLATALHYLRITYPSAPLHGIGFSLGASVLSRYLGETGDESLLSSGIVLGCPWSLPAMSDALEGSFFTRNVYSSAMAQNLLRLFFHHYDANPAVFGEMSEPGLTVLKKYRKKSRGVRLKDVDELMVSQMGGPKREGMWPFEGADEYYNWASADKYILGIRRPLLSINAFDDPIIHGESLPIAEFTKSTHVYEAITGSGGHLGWFDGPRSSKTRWVLKPVQEFFTAAFRDLPPCGAKITARHGGEASGAGDASETEVTGRMEGKEAGEWTWIDQPAHECGQVVGWRILADGEIIQGKEDTGVLQGL